MLSQSEKIQLSFHRALSSYNDEAVVQKASANKLVKLLIDSGLDHSLERVFEFGCGTGFLTKQLTTNLNINELIVNDLISECEGYLNSYVNDYQRINFITGDIETIDIPNKSELICSTSCVQWSNNLPKLLNRLAQGLTGEGWLALSSFTKGHFNELALMQNSSVSNNKLNYWTIENWREHLNECFDVLVLEQDQKVLWFNTPREVLVHLRLTGVNGNSGQTWSQQALAEFENNYRLNFEHNGKIPLTYRPIYIVARKKGAHKPN